MSLSDYIEEKPILNTKRLILRSMDKQDVPALKEWLSESSLYEYWGKKASKAEKIQNYFLKKRKRKQKVFTGVLFIRKIIR